MNALTIIPLPLAHAPGREPAAALIMVATLLLGAVLPPRFLLPPRGKRRRPVLAAILNILGLIWFCQAAWLLAELTLWMVEPHAAIITAAALFLAVEGLVCFFLRSYRS